MTALEKLAEKLPPNILKGALLTALQETVSELPIEDLVALANGPDLRSTLLEIILQKIRLMSSEDLMLLLRSLHGESTEDPEPEMEWLEGEEEEQEAQAEEVVDAPTTVPQPQMVPLPYYPPVVPQNPYGPHPMVPTTPQPGNPNFMAPYLGSTKIWCTDNTATNSDLKFVPQSQTPCPTMHISDLKSRSFLLSAVEAHIQQQVQSSYTNEVIEMLTD